MNDPDEAPPEWAKERAREVVAEAAESDDTTRTPDIPAAAVDEAERLTRLAREAADTAETERYRERRGELAAEFGYTARVREADETLVLYPAEWMAAGTAQLDRIEDTNRAVEVSLSGPGDADRYREVAEKNDAVVEAVRERTESVHAETAHSLAAFMSNHYVRPIHEATPEMYEEFRTEYFHRNAWPSDTQRDALAESLERIKSVAAALEES